MGPFLQRILKHGPDSPPAWAAFGFLWLLSGLYRLVVAARRFGYVCGILPAYRASVPVISVGNLTAGGTGKTPVVDYLVRSLLGRGLKVAVVSRGYGGNYPEDVGQVSTGDGSLRMQAAACGDEPCLLAQRNPAAMVFVARKRMLGVQAAQRAGAEVVVLDDAFQHWAVRRDLDIVLLDARAPFGNGFLLPAGLLRESQRALQRADLLVLTHADNTPPVDLPLDTPILRSRHRLADQLVSLDGMTYRWEDVASAQVVAFAGIANPEQFFEAVRKQGVPLSSCLGLEDHQVYSKEVLDRLRQACHNQQLVLTTEKDAVKMSAEWLPIPCLRVPLVLELDDVVVLEERLDQILKGKAHAPE